MKLTAVCLALMLYGGFALANEVYLLRHAEKLPTTNDPALSECGRQRAAALALHLQDINFTAVYATPYLRTQQTAAAVATQQQLSVSQYDPRQPEALISLITAQHKPVMVVGHSNTIPQLVKQLTGIEMAPLTEQDYDLLYQVKLSAPVSVTISRQQFQCQKSE